MEEISPEDYLHTLTKLVRKKSDLIQEEDNYKLRIKLFPYLHQKGYETELINQVLDAFFKAR